MFGPMMMPGMGMSPMFGMGPMAGMFMMMQMMQMMQMLQMMMGQQGCGGTGFGGFPNAGMGMNDMMGMGCGPPVPQMPYWGGPQGAAPPFQDYSPRCGCHGGGNWGPREANPGAEIPNFGPNPNKQQIDSMLNAACAKYGVPPEIAKAVAYQESGWNPRASSFDGGHGKGIMQIDDRSHQFARSGAVWDPAANIDYGVRLLADNYKRSGGNWHTAIRRYNGSGPAAENYANRVTSLAQQQPWHRWGV